MYYVLSKTGKGNNLFGHSKIYEVFYPRRNTVFIEMFGERMNFFLRFLREQVKKIAFFTDVSVDLDPPPLAVSGYSAFMQVFFL